MPARDPERPHLGWAAPLRMLIAAGAIVAVTVSSRPRPGLHGVGLAVSIGLAALLVTSMGYLYSRASAPRWTGPWLFAVSVCGLAVGAVVPDGVAFAFPVVVAWLAVVRERVWVATGLTALGLAGHTAVELYTGGGTRQVFTGLGIYLGSAFFAFIIRLSNQARAREREVREQVGVAQARTAVLDERARIAREIHDILAHTLSAQSVQLEGARLLLGRGASADQVLERVEQAQRLTREGMEETRRAVHALRGDALPTTDLLASLADEAGASFRIEGPPRTLPPEAGLAVFRTAQEALTNARKHAPGASVSMVLRYSARTCVLEVADDGRAAEGALAGTGAGYGLTGLRERAELVGGSLTAEPTGSGFLVRLELPVEGER